MGLLDRANTFLENDNINKSSESSDGGAEKRDGLLKRAENILNDEETEESSGLLKRAESLLNEEVVKKDETEKKKEGLLEKAESIKGEFGVDTIKEDIEEKTEGLLEKAEMYNATDIEELEVKEEEEEGTVNLELEEAITEEEGEKIFSEEVFSGAELIEKEVENIKKEVMGKKEEKVEEIKEDISKTKGKTASKSTKLTKRKRTKKKEISSEEKDYSVLLRKAIMADDIVTSENISEEIILERGFLEFSKIVLNILAMATGAEAGIIFVQKGDLIRKGYIYPDKLPKKYKILNLKLKKNERVISLFISSEPIFSKNKTAGEFFEILKKEEEVRPWLVVPLVVHGIFYGFIMMLKIDESRRPSKKLIKMISIIYGSKLAIEILEDRYLQVKDIEDDYGLLTKTINNVKKYSYLNEDDFIGLFNDFCKSMDIEIGSLVVYFNGVVDILAVYGIKGESRVNYTIEKLKYRLSKILTSGKPQVVEGIGPESFKLVGEDSKKANTLIVVPIVSGKEPYGAIIIHRLKDRSKKLSKTQTERLAILAHVLSPAILIKFKYFINNIDTIYPEIEGSLKWADKNKKHVYFVRIYLVNSDKIIEKIGFIKYSKYYNELREILINSKLNVKFWYPSPFYISGMFKEGSCSMDDINELVNSLIETLKKRYKAVKDLEIDIKIGDYPGSLKGIRDIESMV